MTMIVRYEVTDLAAKIPGSSSPVVTKRLFNADLALIDGQGRPRPDLAADLPRLNTDAWRLYPDGRMETTYRLRPSLTWHDGQPLTANDFVFAARVYQNPSFGIFTPQPQDRIGQVLAPDPQTLVIQWNAAYPGAGALIFGDLDPLPRHILEGPLAAVEDGSAAPDTFVNLPFWTTDYVGAGPYRLERWTPGAQFDAAAFDGYALGRPKIDRIVVRIIGDENAVLSAVLAGNADFTADFTLRFEHGQVLKREWEALGKGKVMFKPSSAVVQMVQLRPEFAAHPGQLDARVRRAMAATIDRDALNAGLFEGQGFTGDTLVPPTVSYFADVDRAITKYPYDVRRAEQYMAEAGYTKDQDGFYATRTGDRFHTDVRVTAGPEFERGQAILIDTWRRAGFDVSGSVLAAAEARDREARQTFPGMASRGGGFEERSLIGAEIGSAANRWTGDNRGGWSSAEYDRVYDSFSGTLDRDERERLGIQMLKLISDDVPVYPMYIGLQVNAQVAGLSGPDPGTSGFGALSPATLPYWNIGEWELRAEQ
ncbi:MAG TPA: ABC transporter substrate-binding protein [Chloroflexota bacterium]|nr:ABC transporter substrate-binding protein [Chloroflexota bacterium]